MRKRSLSEHDRLSLSFYFRGQRHLSNRYTYLALVLFTSVLFTSCAPVTAQPTPAISTPIAHPEALITFRLSLPQPIPPGNSIYLTFVDEVTGLPYNTRQNLMQAEDSTHFSVILPIQLGTVIKYTYTLKGENPAAEVLVNGNPIRYRLFHVQGPALVDDTLNCWGNTTCTMKTGRITGQVNDQVTGQPLPGIMVTAAGAQTITLADGTYLLEGLPPGTHQLVAYAMDGAYKIYQQGATVAADSATPSQLSLEPAKEVIVTITLSVPENTPSDAILRLAGNLSQLGNTFTDLRGGVSTLASRMPVLVPLADGRYSINLLLPAGADIQYKYTLGDGLWNAEYTASGQMRLRQLIVPDNDIEIFEQVEAWQASGYQPVHFQARFPAHTPQDETISIQFNPGFGWLEPIPMWPALEQGINVRQFSLFSPLQSLTSLQYRYCRQDQCGLADDASTAGSDALGRSTPIGEQTSPLDDTIENWVWYPNTSTLAVVPNLIVRPRAPGFVAGIALSPSYHASWGPYLSTAITEINKLHPNLVVFSPTWSFSRQNPPVLEPLLSQDISWRDLQASISHSHSLGMNVALFPSTNLPGGSEQWWLSAPRDFSWWVSWFEAYQAYAIHHADLASQTGAQTLILGGEWLSPALPGGVLADGTTSNAPQDTEIRWRDLLQEIRSHFSGTLAWAVTYSPGIKNPPPFLDLVDQVYLVWQSIPLASVPGASENEMKTTALSILDEQVIPFQQSIGKPVILAVSYPSTPGAAAGCPQSSLGACSSSIESILSLPDPYATQVDLDAQLTAYNALFLAINERDVVSGIVSMGYYPPVALRDPSISVHGKPAAGALWFWFSAFWE